MIQVLGTFWPSGRPKEGFYVFAGCLFSDGNEAKELLSSPNVHGLQLDVTKEDQVELALEEVKKNLGGRGT